MRYIAKTGRADACGLGVFGKSVPEFNLNKQFTNITNIKFSKKKRNSPEDMNSTM